MVLQNFQIFLIPNMLKSEVQAMMVSYFLPPKRKKFKKSKSAFAL